MSDDYEMLAQILQGLSPEELAQYAGGGSEGMRTKFFEEQLAQAEALRGGQPRATTGRGAMMGALGQVTGAIGSSIGQAQAMKGMQGLAGGRDARTMMVLKQLMAKKQAGIPLAPEEESLLTQQDSTWLDAEPGAMSGRRL